MITTAYYSPRCRSPDTNTHSKGRRNLIDIGGRAYTHFLYCMLLCYCFLCVSELLRADIRIRTLIFVLLETVSLEQSTPGGSGRPNCSHRCQHGLRKMRESARNDISRAHANFARAHKMRANYHISIHAITLYKM